MGTGRVTKLAFLKLFSISLRYNNQVKVFKNISMGLMAILILFSATGLTLVKHYCMGELKTVSLHESHDTSSCHEVVQAPSCHEPEGANNCCDTEKDKVQTDEYNAADEVKLNKITDYAVADIKYTKILTYLSNLSKGYVSYNYTIKGPPADRQAALQVFII